MTTKKHRSFPVQTMEYRPGEPERKGPTNPFINVQEKDVF